LDIGYIWPTREEWGKKRFYEINEPYDYGYSISRSLKKGDVLVFYSDKNLIGSIPVYKDSKRVTAEDLKTHPKWVHDWKYVVGLDGSSKVVFPTSVSVEEVAGDIKILKGKKNLHAVCRNAPRISVTEYNHIMKAAMKT